MTFGKRVSLFLLPSIVQGMLSLGMVPVITYVLGPEEYGVFALVSAITALVTVVGAMGSGYLLAEHYPMMSIHERRQMISTIVITGTTILAVFIGVFLFLWPRILQDWYVFAAVPLKGIILSLAAMLFAFPWTIAIDIITLDAKARLYAVVTIIQSIASAVTVTIGLYIFEWGLLSLFVAAAVAAIVLFGGALIVLRPYIRLTLSKLWAREIVRIGLPATAANIMENLQTFFERYVLSVHVGLSQLGLYSHSQQYRNLVSMPVKAIARSVWPITLSESRNDQGEFSRTKEAWDIVYVGITLVGVLFATVGKDLIAFWTHNKFTDAYWLVAVWMAFMLVQNSGKVQTGIMYSSGQSAYYSKMLMVTSGAAILLLLILVPTYGLVGAMQAVFAQQITFRVAIQLSSRRYWKSLFHDKWVLVGLGVILLALGLENYFQFDLRGNIVLFLALCIPFGVLSRQVIVTSFLKATGCVGLLNGTLDGKAVKSIS